MRKLSRRDFLKSTGTVMAAGSLASAADAKVLRVLTSPRKMPSQKVARLADLKEDHPIAFTYPDPQSMALLVKLDREAVGGVGPGKRVVAFSRTCTHMGCPLEFKRDVTGQGRFVCPCHYSMFDPARNGSVYQGLATDFLPQIHLQIRRNGDIYATGVEGLLWGRVSNRPLK